MVERLTCPVCKAVLLKPDIADGTYICPRCEHAIELSEERYALHSSTHLRKPDETKITGESPRPEISCPNCGTMIRPNQETCPRCDNRIGLKEFLLKNRTATVKPIQEKTETSESTIAVGVVGLLMLGIALILTTLRWAVSGDPTPLVQLIVGASCIVLLSVGIARYRTRNQPQTFGFGKVVEEGCQLAGILILAVFGLGCAGVILLLATCIVGSPMD